MRARDALDASLALPDEVAGISFLLHAAITSAQAIDNTSTEAPERDRNIMFSACETAARSNSGGIITAPTLPAH